MKKLNNTKKTRRIAIALASLSMISAMAMPFSYPHYNQNV